MNDSMVPKPIGVLRDALYRVAAARDELSVGDALTADDVLRDLELDLEEAVLHERPLERVELAVAA